MASICCFMVCAMGDNLLPGEITDVLPSYRNIMMQSIGVTELPSAKKYLVGGRLTGAIPLNTLSAWGRSVANFILSLALCKASKAVCADCPPASIALLIFSNLFFHLSAIVIIIPPVLCSKLQLQHVRRRTPQTVRLRS